MATSSLEMETVVNVWQAVPNVQIYRNNVQCVQLVRDWIRQQKHASNVMKDSFHACQTILHVFQITFCFRTPAKKCLIKSIHKIVITVHKELSKVTVNAKVVQQNAKHVTIQLIIVYNVQKDGIKWDGNVFLAMQSASILCWHTMAWPVLVVSAISSKRILSPKHQKHKFYSRTRKICHLWPYLKYSH